MTIDFGALPPEITSARLYSGPGSSAIVAAAAAWNSLAAELGSAAAGYDTVVAQLSAEEWLGPASASMAEAVTPYVSWLSTTSTLAEQAGTQAAAAAAAFETAFASVVPPPLIALNRTELAQALANNVFGQNTNVISALEAQYGEFWAQDSAAMYSYAGSSASAASITPFSAAPPIASPAAGGTQAAAVTAATGTSVSSIQQSLNALISQIAAQLNALVSPLVAPFAQEASYLESSNGPLSWLWQFTLGVSTYPQNLQSLLTQYTPYAGFLYNTEGLPYFSIGLSNSLVQTAKTVGALGGAAPAAAAAIPKPPGIGGALGAGAGAGSQVAAGLGSGAHVGQLAVPASWSGSTAPSAVRPAVEWVSESRAVPEASAGNVLGGMPVGTGGAARGAGMGPRYGFKPTVMPRPVVAG
jgi:PPE-repeat protein